MSGKGAVGVRSIVSTGPDVIASRLEDEVVILDLKSGVYHGLEAVGARIWELMGPAAPVQAIRDSLLDEYEVEPERCEQDLLSLLEELNSHGLLEVRHEASDQIPSPAGNPAAGAGQNPGAGCPRATGLVVDAL